MKTFRVKRNRVQQVLARLDESKSVGLDGVSPRVLIKTMCHCPINALDTTVPDDCKKWDIPPNMEDRKCLARRLSYACVHVGGTQRRTPASRYIVGFIFISNL